jgi:branched-chain amino acid transport system ATP-binding protein
VPDLSADRLAGGAGHDSLAASAPIPDPVLGAEGLAVSYGRVRALRSVSLTVRRGGLVLVLGLNGAGKTTLMRALAGLAPLRAGRVTLGGRDISRLPAHRRARQGISLVPEGRGVLPGLTVRDNLDLGWHAAPRSRRGALADAVGRVTDLFPVLGQKFSQDCRTLSGGEMQMLAIARALAPRPSVLLLDEPSLGLAPLVTATVYEALGHLGATGVAAIIVEQKAVPLPVVPDTVLVLRNGSVVHESHGTKPSEAELADLYLSDAGPAKEAAE